jgi:hypothetical protein
MQIIINGHVFITDTVQILGNYKTVKRIDYIKITHKKRKVY